MLSLVQAMIVRTLGDLSCRGFRIKYLLSYVIPFELCKILLYLD